MKLAIFCCSPNFRGIHQYSLYLSRLSRNIFVTSYRSPEASSRRLPKVLAYFQQIFWSLFPGHPVNKVDIEIFSNSYIPFNAFFGNRDHPLRGLVLHDFIHSLDNLSWRCLISTYREFGCLEFFKRIFHTIYSKASIQCVDFVLLNSAFTDCSFSRLLPKQANRLSGRTLVLHPAPSFTRLSVLKSLESLPLRISSQSVSIHVVTGASPSKNPSLLEACLSCLRIRAAHEKISFVINIFGYSSVVLKSLSSDNFILNCHSRSVPEAEIIQSYLLSDLFLSTSSQEGFGIPLLDAILFDLCCVVTPIESFLEIANFYSSHKNTIHFSSSYGIGIADELACSIINASRSFDHLSPKQKAQSYIKSSESIFLSAQENLSEFLKNQFPSCSQ